MKEFFFNWILMHLYGGAETNLKRGLRCTTFDV